MFGVAKNVAPLLIYIVGFVILVLSMSGRVRYGLFLLIPLLPLQNVVDKLHGLPFGKDFNDILLIGMVIGWFVSKSSSKDGLLQKSPLNLLLFLYFIFTYFSLYWGSLNLHEPAPISPLDPRVQRWKNYMILPLLFFLTSNNLRNKDDFMKLLFVMCIGMFLMDFYNVRQVRWMTSWISRAKVHGTFVFLGANEVAAFYATYTFVLCGIWLFMKNSKWRLALLYLIVTGFFIDMFMYSRAAYLSTYLAALFFCAIRIKKLLIPLILIPILWQTVLPERVIQRIEYTEEEGELDASAQTRLLLWEQSLNYFKENPFFGIGFDVFSRIGMKRDTHNVYLRTLAEQGIFGLTFLLVIMLIALNRGWSLYASSDDWLFKGLGLGFAACVISLMVGNFFGDRWTALPLAAHFWVYLGMVERGNNMVREQKRTEGTPQTKTHVRSRKSLV